VHAQSIARSWIEVKLVRMRIPIQLWYGIGNLERFEIFSLKRYSICLSTVRFAMLESNRLAYLLQYELYT